MANYYYLGTLLPELHFDKKPELGFEELEELLAANLTGKDQEKVNVFRRFSDIQNINYYWKGEPLDPYGHFDKNKLEEALLTGIGLPKYVFEYIEETQHIKDPEKRIYGLMTLFFDQEINQTSGFLKQYLLFEKKLRLILAVLRAKKLNWDLAKDFKHQNLDDEFIEELYSQRDAKTLEIPEGFEEIVEQFNQHYENPAALYKDLTKFRFDFIEEAVGSQQFSIDRILGYYIQLIFIERWQSLDRQHGLTIVDTILKELK